MTEMKSLAHEILSFSKSVLNTFNWSTKGQSLHVIMEQQSVKKNCTIPLVGGLMNYMTKQDLLTS